MTRRQMLMARAFDLVQAVKTEPDETRRIYGGLCHTLPVLIRRSGLCQAVALLESKASGSGPQQQAYGLIRDHLDATLGHPRDGVVRYVAGATLEDYLRATRTALAAWEFHKRFAVSLLGMEAGDASEEVS